MMNKKKQRDKIIFGCLLKRPAWIICGKLFAQEDYWRVNTVINYLVGLICPE